MFPTLFSPPMKTRWGDPQRTGQALHRLHFRQHRRHPFATQRTRPRAAVPVHAAELRIPPRQRSLHARETAADVAEPADASAPLALLGLLDRRARVRLAAGALRSRRAAGAPRVRGPPPTAGPIGEGGPLARPAHHFTASDAPLAVTFHSLSFSTYKHLTYFSSLCSLTTFTSLVQYTYRYVFASSLKTHLLYHSLYLWSVYGYCCSRYWSIIQYHKWQTFY